MTFEEIDEKYSKNRDEMNEEELSAFVTDCYEAYEQSGFSDLFWSPYDQYADRIGQPFDVLRRVSGEENDIEVLPMWEIKFNDGFVTLAYPEEIVLCEMIANGYKTMKE